VILATSLECRQLAFDYPNVRSRGVVAPLLKQIDALFPGGRITLVSGHSGVGKSTLLHLLAGLLRPSRGEIRADDQPVSRWLTAHRDRWRRQVGILFQQDHLIGHLTVLENVILPLIPRRGGPRQWRAQGMAMLARLRADELAGAPAVSLSGGQRQRVAAARALVGAPDYIVADEPVAHQDLENARGLGRLLRKAAEQGAVVVVAAHDRHVDEWLTVDGHWHLEHGILHPAS
jgi:ABC-type lipoprotein export system ATPase subunit